MEEEDEEMVKPLLSTKNVTVIDGSDNSILANISISFGPASTATFISSFENADVSPFDIAVNPYTNVGYIIGEVTYSAGNEQYFFDRRLVAIDFANNIVTPYNVNGTGLNVVALNPFNNNIYINDWGRDTVYAINANKEPNNPATAINLDLFPNVVAINPDANIIYVTNSRSDSVSKINGNTSEVIYGVRFDINDGPIDLPIFPGYSISAIPSKSINLNCNGKNISDNDYVNYDNGTEVTCWAHPIHFLSPLIINSWPGFDGNPFKFTVTQYVTPLTGTFIDLESLLQILGPYISLLVLGGVVLYASIPSFSPRIRKLFSTGKGETVSIFALSPDTRKEEITILSKPEIITVDATVIIGVLIFITLSEGSEITEQTQITIITVNIVFPFATSAILAVSNYDKFAIRLMIAGFINLMISVILIALMRI